MRFKPQIILALYVIAFSSFAHQTEEPTSVVLTYGNSSIPTEIKPDKGFSVLKVEDDENTVLSGSVTKEHSDFIVDIFVARDNKRRKSNQEFQTKVLITSEQIGRPILIGGLNNEFFYVTLK